MATNPAALLRHLHRLAPRPPADAQLLERFVRQRDEAAFAALVARHGPLVLRACRRLLADPHAAEDAFQATFLVLARRAAAIRRPQRLAGWLHGVAHRVALKARTAAALRQGREVPSADLAPPDRHPDPLAELTARELLCVLDEELQRLPEVYRLPVLLCCLEGHTQEEAARLLKWTPDSVRGRLERGRARLRQRLARRGLTLPAALAAVGIGQGAASAALPAALAGATARAALAFTGPGGATGGVVSAQVAELAEGGLKGAAAGKVRALAALVLLAGALVGGVGLAAYQARREAPVSDAAPGADPPKPGREAPTRRDLHGDPLPEGAVARMGTARLRHGNGTTLAFTPDGKALLSCGIDGTLRFWAPVTGRLLREQQLPAGDRLLVTILSPDARLLAFREWHGDLCLWDVARNRLARKWPLGRRDWLVQTAFSPDGKALVTAVTDMDTNVCTVKARDVVTGRERLLGQHKGGVASLSFTADGTPVTLDGHDHRTLRFWDLAGGRERSRVVLPEYVPRAAISPDGRTVAAVTMFNKRSENTVKFWGADTGRPVEGWTAPDVKKFNQVQFTPDGKAVLVGTGAGTLVWDPRAGKVLRSLPGRGYYDFGFSPDGRMVAGFATGGRGTGTMLHVWDLATGAPHPANAADQGHLDDVNGLAVAPDGRTVASASSAEGRVCFWEARTGRLLRSLPAENLNLRALAFSPDGKNLFAGTSAAVLRWDVATGREVGRYPLSEAGQGERHHLLSLHVSDDGRTLLAVSQNLSSREDGARGLHAWDVETGRRLRSGRLTVKDFETGSFSPDGRLLAFPGVTLRDAATVQEVLRLSAGEKVRAHPLAFSVDGALLAAGVERDRSGPGFVRWEMQGVQVWELATALPLAWLKTGEVGHAAFTPDGRRLITAGPDALKLWDLAARREVARRPAPGRFHGSAFGASFASSFALAADGHTMATGQPDTTVLLWDLRAPARPAAPLSAAELEACWADLAGAGGGRALTALSRLADAPGQAVPLLRDRLRPARAPAADELRRLLRDLDGADFVRREAATKRLTELGELAEGALREALRGKPSPEVRRRAEALLAGPRLVQAPEGRRHLRAVRALEGIGSPEARRVLEGLSQGAPEARLTREAKAALRRLAQRSAAAP